MNLVVDVGNTRIKAATFEEDRMVASFQFEHLIALREKLGSQIFQHVLISSVNQPDADFDFIQPTGKKLILSPQLPLPIKNVYATPQTLGVDRLAGACGAYAIFPGKNCLVIDAGTCINYEFIDESGTYHGGAISPGIDMRFKAMHTFTARLPLVQRKADADLVGNSTETCMQSGVMNGVVAEVENTIEKYREKYPSVVVLLCGGDAPFFENRLKPTIFAAPDLVLKGLNRILRYNASY
ncbi:MAG: type III pantothenate kinase [Cyclobacteriaceae bacterium]|nr:type III pantothenate kinase [Cyclobacteriaceae bacterium]